MPYSRDARAYPSQFFSIGDFLQKNPGRPYIEAFARDEGAVRSTQEALTYRQKFFAWRRALSREGNALADFLVGYEAQVKLYHQIATDWQPYCSSVAKAKFMLAGRPDPLLYCYFILEPRDNSVLAKGIDATLAALNTEALSRGDLPIVPPVIQPNHERLLEAARRITGHDERIGDGARSAFESIYGPIQARGESKNETPGEDIPPAYPLDPRQPKDESTDK